MGEDGYRKVGAFLSLVGLGVAIYITAADAGGGAPVCVAGGHGCQTVADSSYSHLAGINVSVLGIGGYLVLLAAFAAPGDAGRFIGLLAALIGFGFSLYLTYLELFTIDAICQWCVASAVVMTAILVVAGLRAYRYSGAEFGVGPPRVTEE
jgi:uncharacterized membrane protein